ncbi:MULTISPECIES: TetR/AcrR family transcriptional regulator [Dyella]|uniref:TetR/AcrR family transcriptional regulator n=2 Tax=Dyella TaxID=231454 RepID=A0A4R0YVK8_9GAMM|nr:MULTISPECIES: TetR/AcrR family transcriptional regulator [Dyella]TBR39898.1 TetR/AcrR family transcriptional regulator [Dyella terrae]TCI12521.1 TetR/AcrR family transcriptional regulator [Dyella soli]
MKTDPSNLIEVSLSLFRSKGYRRTSMADIGRATGLLKGSIYHHFPNKERLLIEVIQHVIGLFEDGVFTEARRPDLTEKQRLDGMIDAVESYYIQHRVCALVHLWPDALQESAEARELIQKFFRDWRDLVSDLLKPKYGQAEAHRLATDALARIEGAVIWLQIVGEEQALKQCSEEIRKLL